MCGSPSTNREPYQFVVYPSAARTAAPTAATFYNEGNFNTFQLYFVATAKSATPSVTAKISLWDSKANAYVDVLTSAALTDVGSALLQVGGVGANVSNVTDMRHPGKRIKVTMAHGDSDELTYSVTGGWVRS